MQSSRTDSPRTLHELDLHITNRCTLRCAECCFDSGTKCLGELTLQKTVDTLHEASALGCRELHITGGEPLLREDIESIVAVGKSLGMESRLQTNGTLMSRKRAESLVRAGLRRVMLSLDSADEGLNDALRGHGAHDAAIRAIQVCRDVGLHARVNSVLSSRTLGGFPAVVATCAALGVLQVSGFYFSPIGRGRRNADLWIPPDQYVRIHEAVEEELSGMRGRTIPAEMDVVTERAYASWFDAAQLDTRGFTGCGGGCTHAFHGRDYLIIRSDGNVYPCIMMVEWDDALGNVHEHSLQEIWEDDRAWQMLDRSVALNACGNCEHAELCQGGCAGYARLFAGSSLQPDPRCARGERVPLCPIMKYNSKTQCFGGSSEDVLTTE